MDLPEPKSPIKQLHDSLQNAAVLPLRHFEFVEDGIRQWTQLHVSFTLSQWDLYRKFDPMIARLVQKTKAESLVEVAAYLVFPTTADSLHQFIKDVQLFNSPSDMSQIIHITFVAPDLYKFSTMVERAARAKYEAEFNTQIEQVLRDGR